ncbi:MAG TPA: hypothetical protein VK419_14255 [Bryobacteraceae bacterium]|nr:hypothetical protein [Bryobacteraceae bacterium]
MIRFFAILIVSAAAALAQNSPAAKAPDPLAPLRQVAEQKTAEWEAVARALEPKIGRMLPCDPRIRAAIEEVSRISDSRLAAMSQYLKGAVDMAKRDTEVARAAAASQDDANKDLETEWAEAEQERIAVETQLAELGDSVRRLAALEAAQKKLAEIEAMIRERTQRAQQLADNKSPMTVSLRNLAAAYQARQAALEQEQTALAAETSRWSEYYAARLARAATECSIINQAGRGKK